MYTCRCTKRRTCGKRVSLRKHPDAYKRYPRCPVPGCNGHLNHQPYDRDYDTKRTCYCTGIRYPHRKGAFINAREICHQAEVDDTMGEPVKVVTMRQDDAVPF